jgi:hypothetical protein
MLDQLGQGLSPRDAENVVVVQQPGEQVRRRARNVPLDDDCRHAEPLLEPA